MCIRDRHSLTRNYCLMQLRSKRIMVSDEGLFDDEAYEAQVAHTPENNDELDVQLADLGDCLQTLVVEQRKSVELFYFQQLCYQQIADQTGFALTKVKSYLQNGKRNLKPVSYTHLDVYKRQSCRLSIYA